MNKLNIHILLLLLAGCGEYTKHRCDFLLEHYDAKPKQCDIHDKEGE